MRMRTRLMTTYLLLALGDDGVAAHYASDMNMLGAVSLGSRVLPVGIGTDRGPYSVYEVAGYSIDVVRMPEGGEVAK